MRSVGGSFSESAITPRQRWLSLFELTLGSFFVIGHNVFHIVPNEVPILFALFWISPHLREGRWNLSQLRRPKSWVGTIVLAIAAAAVLLLGSEFVVEPLASHFWHSPEQASSLLKTPLHDWALGLRSLAIVWVFAGFGEELGYRGYLLTRAADLGNRPRFAYIASAIYVAVLFGFGHFYKGPTGIVDSTYSGLVLGAVYLISGRNLWAPILTHGLADTVVVVAVFMGWAN